ncbi:MAG TPA: phosphatidylglycerol lysyltransferase domain-containing protein [Noviherbaspirillum sp.]|uniref:phosphatidylglycerol lysyltransferase domain-containing protein n=1 Tax=Noviherbaspirillum sp. TaxID=1926288 RepID=UPI002B498F78|nr:phosphatidylglycerol lysyltransferase domain-containing protein [Noviherbaspirillum sp.]HJV87741.1 phosphatidylglycerol lysyltransferase domain-containing protein [Noviherbaspirillum sp.]
MTNSEGAGPALAQRAGETLGLEHEAEIDGYLATLRERLGKDCLSDFAFSNLYLFRATHAYRYLPGPYPCVAGTAYDGTRHLLPLFDLASAPFHDMRALLAGHDCFFPIAAETAARLDRNRFILSASGDDADYIYPAENFRSYRGELLRKKRNLMQQLLGSTPVHAHFLTPERMNDALQVLEQWMRDKGKAAGEADALPCREALQLSSHFGFESMIYYVDNAPAGFLIAQRLSASVAVMRFAKGNDAYKGIYQYMFHHYCMHTKDIAWINFEQDLGLANFRQTKRSYQPSAMLAKTRVRISA